MSGISLWEGSPTDAATMIPWVQTTCRGTRKDGEPCSSTIVGEDGFCLSHSPTRSAALPEIARLGAEGRRRRRAASLAYRQELAREFLRKNAKTIRANAADALEALEIGCPCCGEPPPGEAAIRRSLARYFRDVHPILQEIEAESKSARRRPSSKVYSRVPL